MLFEKRLRDGLVDGTISVAFRRWRRAQVVPGGYYRLGAGAGRVVVETVAEVAPEHISPQDALAAGFASPDAVRADLGSGSIDAAIFRVQFGPLEADPRDALRESASELAQLTQRVVRIEGADATLAAIAAQPAVRAGDLMGPLGWDDLHRFKLHVRRLKDLGLTISLPVGYRLSPRGEAYLAQRR